MSKGLSYVGDLNGFSRYTYTIEGRRVLDVLVNNLAAAPAPEGVDVPEGVAFRPISIAMVDAPIETRQETKGLALERVYVEEEGVTTRVSSVSVASYVAPRVANFLARLFVPAA